jgi:hypothetical protein
MHSYHWFFENRNQVNLDTQDEEEAKRIIAQRIKDLSVEDILADLYIYMDGPVSP